VTSDGLPTASGWQLVGSAPITHHPSPVMRYRQGYTLIELIMVIVVVGILAGVGAFFLGGAIDIWQMQRSWEEEVTEGRMTMDWMVREIREIRGSDDISIADDDDLEFINSNDVTLRFRWSSSTVLRNSDVLNDTATALLFEYFDSSNTELTSVPLSSTDRSNIWSIKVTLTIPTKTSTGTQSTGLSSVVFPRNLQLEEE